MSLMESLPENVLEKLKTNGYLLLGLSEIVLESVRATLDAAYPFFHETVDQKTSNILPGDLGYRPFGKEYSQSPSYPDQVESFTVNARMPIAVSGLRSASAQVLYERMLATFNILEPIAEAVTTKIANELTNRSIGQKLHCAFHQWSLLQLNYSRPAEVALPFINEPHEDGALVTIAYASGPGLEMQMPNNDFMPITNDPWNVLVIPGEIAWLLSGGQIRPVYHRVRPEPHYNERIALLFFGDINPRLCEPWIQNEINRNIDIGDRVLKNPKRYGLEEWTWK